jgi:hypothetical protein
VRCDRSSSCREGAGKGFEAEGEGEGGIACWPEGETEKQDNIALYIMHTPRFWPCELSFQELVSWATEPSLQGVRVSWAIEPSFQEVLVSWAIEPSLQWADNGTPFGLKSSWYPDHYAR